MSSLQFLSHAALRDWLAGMLAEVDVIAPVRAGVQVVFARVRRVEEIDFAAGRTDLSAKEFFLPASEAILHIRPTAQGVTLDTPVLAKPQVIFGVRPCDAQALDVLDRLFLADPVDVYYAERRAGTTLVGLACSDGPWPGCFCGALGGGPAERRFLDVLLTRTTSGFAVDVISERGAALLARASLQPLGEALPEIGGAPGADLALPDPEAWRSQFNDPYWAEVAERCLGCRTCTYDCPVCYCFDIRDRTLADGSIERLRCWDSCQGALCFAIAGGHNPRPTQAARQRQRYMHKFLYYPQRAGTALCVGCGRCVSQCPANIDIREVIAGVAARQAQADHVDAEAVS